MVLSRTENKLCQPSACLVTMPCLSTAVLRSGCLLCREETCVPFPALAAPNPLPDGWCPPFVGKGTAARPGPWPRPHPSALSAGMGLVAGGEEGWWWPSPSSRPVQGACAQSCPAPPNCPATQDSAFTWSQGSAWSVTGISHELLPPIRAIPVVDEHQTMATAGPCLSHRPGPGGRCLPGPGCPRVAQTWGWTLQSQ